MNDKRGARYNIVCPVTVVIARVLRAASYLRPSVHPSVHLPNGGPNDESSNGGQTSEWWFINFEQEIISRDLWAGWRFVTSKPLHFIQFFVSKIRPTRKCRLRTTAYRLSTFGNQFHPVKDLNMCPKGKSKGGGRGGGSYRQTYAIIFLKSLCLIFDSAPAGLPFTEAFASGIRSRYQDLLAWRWIFD